MKVNHTYVYPPFSRHSEQEFFICTFVTSRIVAYKILTARRNITSADVASPDSVFITDAVQVADYPLTFQQAQKLYSEHFIWQKIAHT